MQVTILLFASYQDIVGADRILLKLADSAHVNDCAAALGTEFPALALRLSSGRIAVNAEFAHGEQALHEGDEVAFLPPMSGG